MSTVKLTKESLIESLKEMTLIEINDLVKALEEEFGVSANMPVMMASGSASAEVEEEKTEFDVILKSSGEKKIQVIKDVREITGLGLKEAKDLVDNGGKVVEGVNAERAKEVKEKLEAAGAVVEMK